MNDPCGTRTSDSQALYFEGCEVEPHLVYSFSNTFTSHHVDLFYKESGTPTLGGQGAAALPALSKDLIILVQKCL